MFLRCCECILFVLEYDIVFLEGGVVIFFMMCGCVSGLCGCEIKVVNFFLFVFGGVSIGCKIKVVIFFGF